MAGVRSIGAAVAIGGLMDAWAVITTMVIIAGTALALGVTVIIIRLALIAPIY